MGKFLLDYTRKYCLSMSEEDAREYARLMERLSVTIGRVQDLLETTTVLSDTGSDDKRPPENATVHPPPPGGVPR